MIISIPCSNIDETCQDIYNTFYPNVPKEGMGHGEPDDIQFEVKAGADIDMVKESIIAVREYVRRMQVMLATNVLVSPTWTNNMILNIPYLLKSENSSYLKDCHKNRPVIIASAGPSLQKQLEVLHKLKSPLPVITVGTSLKPCLVNGIETKLCVSLDSNIKNYLHFKGIYDTMEWDKHTALVYDPMIYPKVLDRWQGRMFAIRTNNAYLHEFMQSYIGELPVMPSGFSVATTALSLAHYIGANPIIFIGQDLAYGVNGESHTHGTIWDGTKITGRENNLMEVSDWDLKGKVLTSQVFAAVLEFFGSMAKEYRNNGIKLINATEGGAYIPHMRHIALREVLKDYPQEVELKLPDMKENNVSHETLREKLKYVYVELSEIHALSKCYSYMLYLGHEPDKGFFSKQIIKRRDTMKFLDHLLCHTMKLHDVKNDDEYESFYRESMTLAHIKLACEDMMPKLKNLIGRL